MANSLGSKAKNEKHTNQHPLYQGFLNIFFLRTHFKKKHPFDVFYGSLEIKMILKKLSSLYKSEVTSFP